MSFIEGRSERELQELSLWNRYFVLDLPCNFSNRRLVCAPLGAAPGRWERQRGPCARGDLVVLRRGGCWRGRV